MADFPENQDRQGDAIQVPPLNIDTAQSDAAIDDIVAQESDELLEAHDAAIAAEAEESPEMVAEEPHGHPVFWFVVAFLAIISMFGMYLLLNPA